jgi:hypothetical protein
MSSPGAFCNQALAWLQSLMSVDRFNDSNLPEGRLPVASVVRVYFISGNQILVGAAEQEQ